MHARDGHRAAGDGSRDVPRAEHHGRGGRAPDPGDRHMRSDLREQGRGDHDRQKPGTDRARATGHDKDTAGPEGVSHSPRRREGRRDAAGTGGEVPGSASAQRDGRDRDGGTGRAPGRSSAAARGRDADAGGRRRGESGAERRPGGDARAVQEHGGERDALGAGMVRGVRGGERSRAQVTASPQRGDGANRGSLERAMEQAREAVRGERSAQLERRPVKDDEKIGSAPSRSERGRGSQQDSQVPQSVSGIRVGRRDAGTHEHRGPKSAGKNAPVSERRRSEGGDGAAAVPAAETVIATRGEQVPQSPTESVPESGELAPPVDEAEPLEQGEVMPRSERRDAEGTPAVPPEQLYCCSCLTPTRVTRRSFEG